MARPAITTLCSGVCCACAAGPCAEIAALRLAPSAVYSISRLNFFRGRPIRSCGWYPDRQVKLWLDEAGERQIRDRQCLTEKLYPPDIARMVLFLAADDSRMCTSQNFIVDGGWV